MDQKTAQRLQGEMNDEVKKIQDSQKRLSSLLSQRGKLLAQQNENEMVEKELAVGRGGDVEEGEAVVWKLVGPVLVKVEVEEARSNVTNRLKWFKEEIGRLDKQQKECEEIRKTAQDKIMKIQETVRRVQQEAVQRQTGAK